MGEHPMVDGQRLGVDRIERRRRDRAVVEGGPQGVLIDEPPAGDVHQVDARLHGREGVGADEVVGVGRQRRGQHDMIRAVEHIDAGSRPSRPRRRGSVGACGAVPAPRCRTGGPARPRASPIEPNPTIAKRRPCRVPRWGSARQFAGGSSSQICGQPLLERQHDRHDPLGDRHRAGASGVGHEQVGRQLAEVDPVHARRDVVHPAHAPPSSSSVFSAHPGIVTRISPPPPRRAPRAWSPG